MPAGLIVRHAAESDWEAISRIHALSWQTAYRGIYPDSFLDREATADRRRFWGEQLPPLGSDEAAAFLAEEAGRAVGFACVRRAAHPAGPLLDNLHVLPHRRGRGIGRALLRAAAAWLIARDPDAPLQLLVWAANAPARRFYASLGAEEVQTIAGATPGGGTAPEIRMRWRHAAFLLERRPAVAVENSAFAFDKRRPCP